MSSEGSVLVMISRSLRCLNQLEISVYGVASSLEMGEWSWGGSGSRIEEAEKTLGRGTIEEIDEDSLIQNS